MSDGWIAVGSIMTGIGSCAIAWQAWLTRDLVKATRDDLATGRRVAVEAVKTRLDSRGPQVTVRIADVNDVPYMVSHYGNPQPITPDMMLRSPADDAHAVVIEVVGEIVNDGSRTANIRTGTDIDPGWAGNVLSPGQTFQFTWWARLLFSQWIGNAPLSPDDTSYATPIAEIEVDDCFDEGVTDTWQLTLHGSPFYQDQATAGVWHVAIGRVDGSLFEVDAAHMSRDYFESKRADRVLVNPIGATDRKV